MTTRVLRCEEVRQLHHAAQDQRNKIEALTNLYLNSLLAQGLLEDLRVSEVMREIAYVKGYYLKVGRKNFKFTKRNER